MKKIVMLLICFLIAIGCSTDDGEKKKQENFTNTLETKNFSVMAPDGWKLIEEQGIDTFIGRITNNTLTIFFDQGFLSFGDLNSIVKIEETIYLKSLTIHGVPAKIHKESTPHDPSTKTRLSLYLESGYGFKNRMYVMDPQNEALILQIFKTHHVR